jgi:hypothetical protein
MMTDYQLQTIIKMILAIARNTTDVSQIIEALEELLPKS